MRVRIAQNKLLFTIYALCDMSSSLFLPLPLSSANTSFSASLASWPFLRGTQPWTSRGDTCRRSQMFVLTSIDSIFDHLFTTLRTHINIMTMCFTYIYFAPQKLFDGTFAAFTRPRERFVQVLLFRSFSALFFHKTTIICLNTDILFLLPRGMRLGCSSS